MIYHKLRGNFICVAMMGWALTLWFFGTSTARAVNHPFLFFTQDDVPALKQKVNQTPLCARMAELMMNMANRSLQTPVSPYPIVSQFNGYGTAGRALQQRVGSLAFAGYLTNDQKYFAKAVEILLAVARQTEPGDKNTWVGHLQQADAAQAFAIGYDWLYPVMNDAERMEVRQEIEKFGTVLFDGKQYWGGPGCEVTACNHNAVHYGALGLCALAVGDHPDWLNRATERVRAYLNTFMDPTGYATEGHGYLGYGMIGALPFSDALRRSGGPDLVGEVSSIPLCTDQILWKLLPSDGILAMNDSSSDPSSAIISYFFFRYKQPVQFWAWLQSTSDSSPMPLAQYRKGFVGEALSAPFFILWCDPSVHPISPVEAKTPLSHFFESGRVFARSKWEGLDAAHFSFTCGYDYSQGHNHQDENAVTLYALGESFLIDPGAALHESRCHNVLEVEGSAQMPKSQGNFWKYREDSAGVFARGEAAQCYDSSKITVLEANRKAYFVQNPYPYVIWRDDAEVAGQQSSRFIEYFHTDPRNKIELVKDGFVITGHCTGAKCLVKVLSAAGEVKIAETDLTAPACKFYNGYKKHDEPYEKYFREATISITGTNPQFIVLVFPYRQESELPLVREIDSVNSRFELSFCNGRSEQIAATADTITVSAVRSETKANPSISRQ